MKTPDVDINFAVSSFPGYWRDFSGWTSYECRPVPTAHGLVMVERHYPDKDGVFNLVALEFSCRGQHYRRAWYRTPVSRRHAITLAKRFAAEIVAAEGGEA